MMKSAFLCLVTIPCLLGLTLAYDAHVYGVDVSSHVSETDAHCLVRNNLTFGIVRFLRPQRQLSCSRSSAWHSYGSVDTNVVATVANMRRAGMHADVYMYLSLLLTSLLITTGFHALKCSCIFFPLSSSSLFILSVVIQRVR